MLIFDHISAKQLLQQNVLHEIEEASRARRDDVM